MRLTLSLSIATALGHGTRPARQPLAVFEVADESNPQDLVTAAWDGTLPQCAITQGVRLTEVITALRSPRCVLIGERAEVVIGSEAVAEAEPKNATANDWRKTFVGRMYFGPDSDRIRRALRSAKIKTAGQIDDEGNARRGLTHIAGISADDQNTIAQTMRGLIESAGQPPA